MEEKGRGGEQLSVYDVPEAAWVWGGGVELEG